MAAPADRVAEPEARPAEAPAVPAIAPAPVVVPGGEGAAPAEEVPAARVAEAVARPADPALFDRQPGGYGIGFFGGAADIGSKLFGGLGAGLGYIKNGSLVAAKSIGRRSMSGLRSVSRSISRGSRRVYKRIRRRYRRIGRKSYAKGTPIGNSKGDLKVVNLTVPGFRKLYDDLERQLVFESPFYTHFDIYYRKNGALKKTRATENTLQEKLEKVRAISDKYRGTYVPKLSELLPSDSWTKRHADNIADQFIDDFDTYDEAERQLVNKRRAKRGASIAKRRRKSLKGKLDDYYSD